MIIGTIALTLVIILFIVVLIINKKGVERHKANMSSISEARSALIQKYDTLLEAFAARGKSTAADIESLRRTSYDISKKAEDTENALNKKINSYKDESDATVNEVKKQAANALETAFNRAINYSDQEVSRTKEYADELSENLTTRFEERISQLASVLDSLKRDNAKLREELNEQKKKLNFYANIEEESGNLTVNEDESERKRLLEIAKAQILANRNKSKAQEPSIETHPEPDESSREAKETTLDTDFVSSPEIKKQASNKETAENSILDSEQERASKYMDSSMENVFITGKAGTGKSFLLDAFVETTDKSNIVLAPTGIAALNVNGATLHSTFGYYNLVNLAVEDISLQTIKLKSEKQLVLKQVHTIVIDEISMVRADTFDKIDRILKAINRNSAPFGGKQMLVFGDLFQLPPVTKGKEYEYLIERYGGIYFFHSDAYKGGNFKFIELTLNHRQTGDQSFFEILNRIREGKSTSIDIAALNQRVSIDDSVYDRYTTLFPTKAEAEYVNQTRLQALESKEFVYRAEVIKDKYPTKTKSIDSTFPITSILKLKVGALIMMVANDPEHRWVNGTMGIVERLTNDAIYVSINRRTYEVQRYEFKEQEIIYKNGRITYEDVFSVSQYPVMLAYAITIHKSQGQTYNNLICDIEQCFTSGQAYVALSRCASLEGLHLKSQVSPTSIKVDHEVLAFYQNQMSKDLLR